MTHRTSHNIDRKLSVKFQFLADVELGVPSKKCRNFGICRIYPLGSAEKLSTSKFDFINGNCKRKESLGSVVSVMKDDSVEICFLRHYIDQLNYHNYFHLGKFTVEEDFYFSSKEDENLNFKIKKGVYPLKVEETLITVLFTN